MIVHNCGAQCSTEQYWWFLLYPADNHYSSDVYWRAVGGTS